MKLIVFRFDVDTHKCLDKGVPNILRLAKKENVKFTFFINTGRSVNRMSSLNNILFKKHNEAQINCFSPMKKLGLIDYLTIVLFNPLIYKNKKIIIKISQENHEIGLHGGSNHQNWQENANKWTEEEIRKEVSWGFLTLRAISNKLKIVGFASPAWNGSVKIYKVLKEMGFRYVADRHGLRSDIPVSKDNLPNILTNILGEPGGVGYLEYSRVLRRSDSEIVKDFSEKLDENELAVMYDHPYYAGVSELKLLEKLIKAAKRKGFKFVTMNNLIKA